MGNWSETLNLPKTTFPMRANLPNREPKMLEIWNETSLYGRIREARKGKKKFILHDGPPYANGHIHIGHALNKILKDFVLRIMTLEGYDCPYVPGWDCHGLPVEHQLLKELGVRKDDVNVVSFRKKAAKYALKYANIQKEEFKRLGILGEWDNPYLTLDTEYEAAVVSLLATLVEQGYVYLGKKPVFWCMECETALADAEVEYADKESPSIFVLFPLKGRPSQYILVWTTTPWTLYANVAIAANATLDYSLVNIEGKEVWVASKLINQVLGLAGVKKENISVIKEAKGCQLKGFEYNHPFVEGRAGKVYLADFVSGEEGTGFVHIAPGHGMEDFTLGRAEGLPIVMKVDEKGRFFATDDFKAIEGQDIKKGAKTIIEHLRGTGLLFYLASITHSYPHCWRCKSPVIFRATDQWFISIDHKGLRDALVKNCGYVRWVPPTGQKRIVSMITSRPDWCISRQRLWGIPIPAFFCESCNTPLLSGDILRIAAESFLKEGSDIWFSSDMNHLTEGRHCSHCGARHFKKGMDILDVWFESGSSFYAVLMGKDGLDYPADVYLEGSDQHRGWFQASLIPSVASMGIAPFKQVITHGFVVDGDGKKMSKSMGNVISPFDVLKKYGADILRMWVASSDYNEDVRLSEEILERLSDAYRKIRNTMRYILSNLYDFDYERDSIDWMDRMPIDRWAYDYVKNTISEVRQAYLQYDFSKAFTLLYQLCNIELSTFYFDVLKDRLYIYAPDSTERRSAQTTLYEIGRALAIAVSPILVFTSAEFWESLVGGSPGDVHCQYWPQMAYSLDGKESEEWQAILSVRKVVLKEMEDARRNGIINSNLEAVLSIEVKDEKLYDVLLVHKEHLKYYFIVSNVDLKKGAADNITVSRAQGQKCERCWHYYEPKPGKDLDLCPRCANILRQKDA